MEPTQLPPLVPVLGRLVYDPKPCAGYGGTPRGGAIVLECSPLVNGRGQGDPHFLVGEAWNGVYKDRYGDTKPSDFGLGTTVRKQFRAGDPVVALVRPSATARTSSYREPLAPGIGERIALADIEDIGPNLNAPWGWSRVGKKSAVTERTEVRFDPLSLSSSTVGGSRSGAAAAEFEPLLQPGGRTFITGEVIEPGKQDTARGFPRVLVPVRGSLGEGQEARDGVIEFSGHTRSAAALLRPGTAIIAVGVPADGSHGAHFEAKTFALSLARQTWDFAPKGTPLASLTARNTTPPRGIS